VTVRDSQSGQLGRHGAKDYDSLPGRTTNGSQIALPEILLFSNFPTEEFAALPMDLRVWLQQKPMGRRVSEILTDRLRNS
jgi:hypothetical protein